VKNNKKTPRLDKRGAETDERSESARRGGGFYKNKIIPIFFDSTTPSACRFAPACHPSCPGGESLKIQVTKK